MRIYAGVTDQDWYDYLRSQPQLDKEISTWKVGVARFFVSTTRFDVRSQL